MKYKNKCNKNSIDEQDIKNDLERKAQIYSLISKIDWISESKG